jgi:hypothetical protein
MSDLAELPKKLSLVQFELSAIRGLIAGLGGDSD